MPDPVGDAFAALIDRIAFLEARVTEMQRRRDGADKNDGSGR